MNRCVKIICLKNLNSGKSGVPFSYYRENPSQFSGGSSNEFYLTYIQLDHAFIKCSKNLNIEIFAQNEQVLRRTQITIAGGKLLPCPHSHTLVSCLSIFIHSMPVHWPIDSKLYSFTHP